MLILEAPIRFMTSSFSLVTVSGLPASTVYSAALCTGKFSGQGLFARDCEGTEPLQIINEIGVDIYPVGVYYKDS